MKSIWQGFISFGLVSIPIKMFSAVNPKAIKFKLVHKKDNSPVKYKRYCEEENKEVSWQEITRSLEVSKGDFRQISSEELKKLKPKHSDFVEIIEFVKTENVDPIYFNSHYFLAPQRAKDKAYFLFKRVLQDTGMLAVGKFIMHEKEHVCTISSYKRGLLLTTLNYSYEIRNINSIEELSEEVQINEPEIKLAKQLIDQLTHDEFEISQFKDTFEEQLLELMNKKEKGTLKASPEKRKKKEENLIATLKASLK